jgi:hypothetical protein
VTSADRRHAGDGAAPPRLSPALAARRMWPRFAVAGVVLVLGTGIAWATARSAERSAEAHERLVADQTASVLTSTVQQLLAAITGVSGLPDAEGRIDEMQFEAYASAVVDDSPTCPSCRLPSGRSSRRRSAGRSPTLPSDRRPRRATNTWRCGG